MKKLAWLFLANLLEASEMTLYLIDSLLISTKQQNNLVLLTRTKNYLAF